MIKLVDKYIIKELIYPFFFGVIAFTSISAGVGVLPNLIAESTKYNLPVDAVVKLFFSRLPEIIVYTFPTSILLASLVAFNRLSSDSEVTAFKSSGVSFYRLIVPALVVGVVISMMTITFNEEIVPKANNYAELVLLKAKTTNKPALRQSIAIPEYEGGVLKRTIYANSLKGQTMNDVTVIENDEQGVARVIYAREAMWQKSGGWIFLAGVMHNFSAQDKLKIITIAFTKEYINISYTPEDLLITKEKKEPKNMNYRELSAYISQRTKAGLDNKGLMIQLHQKASIPFACFIFTLLGAPMGVKPTRGSSTVGIGLSLLVVVMYYIMLATGQWLGTYGAIPPWLAAWIPNIVTGMIGSMLLIRVSR
ncbi:MAG: hypothetical protein DKM50_05345 [Candidatus Margulisiibacteriota bacterium]|nr:MAG: hypothetical protein DKM50_05345 [Candidatus Margulisiibacteriota bacterium]HCT86405.1 hypothetical protein [Candidatus Margulisiibacteriota bacterium]HCY36388.1 hypothetical protein [Candidatus Margulisiibacteriota bacterium]